MPVSTTLRDSSCSSLDDESFARLFDESKPELIHAISKRIGLELGRRVSPSDVLQEAFLTAQQRLDHYLEDPKVPMIFWLRGICSQVISIFYRRHFKTAKRSVSRERLGDENKFVSIEHQMDSATSPSGCLIKQEQRQRILELVNSLPSNDRRILTLRHVEMLSNDEAACSLGLAPATAKKRHTRAMKRLTRLAEDKMDSGSNY